MQNDIMSLVGVLKGHSGWVTCIVTLRQSTDLLISGSRDKTLIVWDLKGGDPLHYGQPRRSFTGHSHYVSDIVASWDENFVLSASWDGTLRLWEIASGTCHRRFIGHEKDVLSVSFSSDNRQIVSGSRDRTIKLWNTLGVCKYTIAPPSHQDWVSCVRFTPDLISPAEEPHKTLIVSVGWDKMVKVWSLETCQAVCSFPGHSGYLNTVTVSPDNSMCASGGKDGIAMVWSLETKSRVCSFDAGDIVNALVFSPKNFWLCAGTRSSIRIWVSSFLFLEGGGMDPSLPFALRSLPLSRPTEPREENTGVRTDPLQSRLLPEFLSEFTHQARVRVDGVEFRRQHSLRWIHRQPDSCVGAQRCVKCRDTKERGRREKKEREEREREERERRERERRERERERMNKEKVFFLSLLSYGFVGRAFQWTF